MPNLTVVGRETETERIHSFLSAIDAGPCALVVNGEAGIGKTTLWRAAIDAAVQRSIVILACRPAEAEAVLAFSGLADMLADVADSEVSGLPDPQRRALSVALLRADEDTSADPRLVATAFTTVLQRLAARGPVLLAVDDIQWLDPASSRVLAFAVRRLAERQVGVLLARRTQSDGAVPLGLDAALSAGAVERLSLGPMSLRALHRLLSERMGAPLPRPVLVRVARVSGGNPFFALEIARALARTDMQARPGAPLPVPDLLRDLLAERLNVLSPVDRGILLLAAAGNVSERTLHAEPDGTLAVRRAEHADLVEIERGQVRFVHPLLAATLYADASAAERRAAHRRLAAVTPDAVHRARHLALASSEPDAAVATTLEDAAAIADRRGTPDGAVELLELALDLTREHDVDDELRRRLFLARQRFRAGDAHRAQAEAEDVRARSKGTRQAEAFLLLAEIDHEVGSGAAAIAHCEEALRTVDERDIEVRARVHATAARLDYADFESGLEHARRALELVEGGVSEPWAESQARQAIVQGELLLGRGFRREDALRAIELERESPPSRVADRASAAFGAWLGWVDELDAAREALEATRQEAVDEGDESSVPYALSHLPLIELRAGNWPRARAVALELLELAEATGQDFQRAQALYLVATVDSFLGDVDQARAAAAEAMCIAASWEDRWFNRAVRTTLGFCDLSVGELGDARMHLEQAEADGRAVKIVDPGQRRETLLLAEVLSATGELDRATALVDAVAADAARLDRPAWRAKAARVRGLIANAAGNLDAAGEAFADAREQHDRVSFPFDVAQTWLAIGQLERRRGKKTEAHDALQRAVDGFATLGAAVWADRARTELSRVGLRRGMPGELTPTERRVAELAADGRTNREVASALFLSPKTVEANLSRAYAKLGIRSRAELGRVMAAEQIP